jgi:hypothetical protein
VWVQVPPRALFLLGFKPAPGGVSFEGDASIGISGGHRSMSAAGGYGARGGRAIIRAAGNGVGQASTTGDVPGSY